MRAGAQVQVTATDDAIFKGIQAKADLIVCSPCCHQELRPQIKAPAILKDILKHGIILEREAEMLTRIGPEALGSELRHMASEPLAHDLMKALEDEKLIELYSPALKPQQMAAAVKAGWPPPKARPPAWAKL